MNDSELQPIDIVTQQAHQAFIEMGSIKGVERSKAVKQMAIKLKECLDDILQANTLDLEISKEMAVPELISDWLKLTPKD